MLHLIKASAGSGKTYRLTGEYIELLFQQPDNYRHILAVTFTNKATEEMKSRIVNELNRLAAGQPSGYLQPLMTRHRRSEEWVRAEARRILIAILHDYSAFSISTIDRFFQHAVRSFAREIGLHGGYNVELDANSVIAQAIDRLLFDLEGSDNEALLQWLVRFAASTIEEGKGWNIRHHIGQLSGELLKEKYKQHEKQLRQLLADKSFLTRYQESLRQLRDRYEQTLVAIGRRGEHILQQSGFGWEDSAYKELRFFARLASGERPPVGVRLMGLCNNVEKWTPKAAPPAVKAAAQTAYANGLNDCLNEALDHLEHDTDYNTAGEIARQLFALGILADIDRKMRDYAEERNIMLLSDTTELLHKIVAGSDAPFIYEKIGTRVHHYMIDEFQDTSGMQWSNFSPLVHDSLSGGNDNLIVGDVKQSIYRWRNSDWSLLGSELQKEIDPTQLHAETLQRNYRSCHAVVAFNNAFFTTAAALLQHRYAEATGRDDTRITDAYGDVAQQADVARERAEGHVQVHFLTSTDDENWRHTALTRTLDEIDRLQSAGYAPREIGILVRTKDEGSLVAQQLLKAKADTANRHHRYDFISDEALYIGRSPAVALIVAVLTTFHQPNEPLQRLIIGNRLTDDHLPQIDRIRRLPLFDQCEQIVALFGLADRPEEGVFIQAFQDIVVEYLRNNPADLGQFLHFWKQTGVRRTIAAPKGQDAIQIITIHKSKGLEFRCVIVPFGDWAMNHSAQHTNILWCEPATPPFNALPVVPIKYGKPLLRTHFADAYAHELLYAYVDNLNLCYVAFTRAEETLTVFAPSPDEGRKDYAIGALLYESLNTPAARPLPASPYTPLADHWLPDSTTWENGHTYPQTPRPVVSPPPAQGYRTTNGSDRLHLRLHSKGFFNDKEERRRGNLLHNILSCVRTAADLPDAIARKQLEGVIARDERQAIAQYLTQAIAHPDVREWFDGSYRTLNEVEILTPKGRFFRPDRVMVRDDQAIVVDYKFGLKQDPSHIRQVERYAALIRQMGYRSVTAYLWYVELQQIITIDNV